MTDTKAIEARAAADGSAFWQPPGYGGAALQAHHDRAALLADLAAERALSKALYEAIRLTQEYVTARADKAEAALRQCEIESQGCDDNTAAAEVERDAAIQQRDMLAEALPRDARPSSRWRVRDIPTE